MNYLIEDKEYYDTSFLSEKWNLKKRNISEMCKDGKIKGALKIGGKGKWYIPCDAKKPINDVEIKIVLSCLLIAKNNKKMILKDLKDTIKKMILIM